MRVEQVEYRVNWTEFKPGQSIFIPCVNCVAARAKIRDLLTRRKIYVFIKIVVEDSVQGLRIWRT
jgi:hypothetical protein